MKRFFTSLIVILASLIFTMDVSAASFKTALAGTTEFEDSTTLNIVVNNMEGFTGTCNGLCGLTADLDYDSSKIKVEIEGMNGFIASGTNHLVIYKSTGVASGTAIAKLKVTNLTLKADESTTITLTKVLGTDNSGDISGSGASTTLKIKIATTKENVTTKTTTKKKTNTTKKTTVTTSITTTRTIQKEATTTTEKIQENTTKMSTTETRDTNSSNVLVIAVAVTAVLAIIIIIAILKFRK